MNSEVSRPEAVDLPEASTTIEVDRRMFPRYASRSQASLFLSHDRMRMGLTADIWDISIAGMGIVLDKGLPPGEWMGMKLSNPVQRFSCEVRGMVLWSEATADGKFRAGIRFLRRLTPVEVNALRGRPRQDSASPTWM